MRKAYITPLMESFRVAAEGQILVETRTRIDGGRDVHITPGEVGSDEEIGAKAYLGNFEDEESDLTVEDRLW